VREENAKKQIITNLLNINYLIKLKYMKILILCTGNSCRSKMAEGFLKSFSLELEVYSAGTNPSIETHPKAIQVMNEIGIDISNSIPAM